MSVIFATGAEILWQSYRMTDHALTFWVVSQRRK